MGNPLANSCTSCGEEKDDVERRYSFGVYAGRMCESCAINGYRDACGLLDGQQGDPNDLDEPYNGDGW